MIFVSHFVIALVAIIVLFYAFISSYCWILFVGLDLGFAFVAALGSVLLHKMFKDIFGRGELKSYFIFNACRYVCRRSWFYLLKNIKLTFVLVNFKSEVEEIKSEKME